MTTPSRTLLDLAATGPPGRLEIALGEALALRLLSLTDVVALGESQRRGARSLRALLQEAPGYTRQDAERRLRVLVRRARLPPPRLNVRLLGHERDAVWLDHRLVVEVDGYAAHGHRHAFERDRRRDQQLAAAGYGTIRVTWRQLTAEPEAVIAVLAAALIRADAAHTRGDRG